MRPASRPITITTCLSTFFSARHSNNPLFTIYTVIYLNDDYQTPPNESKWLRTIFKEDKDFEERADIGRIHQ
jgi:hypothetical protein